MSENPSLDASADGLRVAVVGAGPAGFYSALALLGTPDVSVSVDMFDRLPAPYGLVRYGVAPDHQKIKSVTAVYERGAERAGARFRYFGNVDVGKDLAVEELRARYHAIVLSQGAQMDRRLGIPGEDLPGVYAAREFVAWYNSHPDYADAKFDLDAERAIVVGVGNVAIDVARILERTDAELSATDINPDAQRAIVESPLKEVIVMARRGPAQAACTPAELREMSRMEHADLVVPEAELKLDALSQDKLDSGELDRENVRNLDVLRELTRREPRGGREVIRMRFYLSPIEIIGTDRVQAVRVQYNDLVEREDGRLATKPTDRTAVIPCGVVFRSIGYKVAPMAGVPFDADWSRIPHDKGQVLDARNGAPVPGLFVAGWAKRGPSGIIGTNKPDAVETVGSLLEARDRGGLAVPVAGDVVPLLRERGVRFVTYDDWKRLDSLERQIGAAEGRPRSKFVRISDALEALDG